MLLTFKLPAYLAPLLHLRMIQCDRVSEPHACSQPDPAHLGIRQG